MSKPLHRREPLEQKLFERYMYTPNVNRIAHHHGLKIEFVLSILREESNITKPPTGYMYRGPQAERKVSKYHDQAKVVEVVKFLLMAGYDDVQVCEFADVSRCFVSSIRAIMDDDQAALTRNISRITLNPNAQGLFRDWVTNRYNNTKQMKSIDYVSYRD